MAKIESTLNGPPKHNRLGSLRRWTNHLITEPVDRASRPIDNITRSAVLYLALPNLIFFFGWFKLPLALLLSALMLISLQQGLLGDSPPLATALRLSKSALFCLALAALAWAAFGGAGHFGFANPDWRVRDAVYGDLFQNDWPLAYASQEGAPLILRSAIGYFLPAALATKHLGVAYADILLFTWTALGAFLFLALLPLPAKPCIRFFACVLIAVMFSGMDIIGILITTGDWPIFPACLEWWTKFTYPSLSGQLYWGPNHAIPIWIGTALFIRHCTSPQFARLACLYVPLTLIWTPFAIIGLVPFLGLYLLRWLNTRDPFPRPTQLIFALTLGILLFFFLTLNISQVHSSTGIAHAGGESSFWDRYPVFILAEFLTLALLVWARLPKPSASFYLAVLVLLALPFVFFGPSNDLLLRASTPPLIILLASTLSLFNRSSERKENRFPWFIVCVLTIGATTPFVEMWRAATWPIRPPNYNKNLVEADHGMPAHYIGKLDKLWLAALMKPVQFVRTSSEKTEMK